MNGSLYHNERGMHTHNMTATQQNESNRNDKYTRVELDQVVEVPIRSADLLRAAEHKQRLLQLHSTDINFNVHLAVDARGVEFAHSRLDAHHGRRLPFVGH